MIRMGFSSDEIQDSLMSNKYDEVMATYLLLDEKRVSYLIGNNDILNHNVETICWDSLCHCCVMRNVTTARR